MQDGQGTSGQRAQGVAPPCVASPASGQITALRGTQGASWPCRAQRSELSKARRPGNLRVARQSKSLNAPQGGALFAGALCFARRGRAGKAGRSAATPSRAGAQSWARPRAQCFATLSASVPGAPRAPQGDARLPVQSSSVRCTGTHSNALHRLHSAPTPGAAVRLSTLCKAIHRALSMPRLSLTPHAGTLSRAELRALNAALPGNAHGPKQSYAPRYAA